MVRVEDVLKYATPEEKAHLLRLHRRKKMLLSPLDYAEVITPGTVRYPHTEMLNEYIVALCDYRLYHDGPGPEPVWFYRTSGGDVLRASGPENIPFSREVEDFWGEHPDRGDRLVLQLGIAMPPRHGKSFIVTEHTPGWFWEKYGAHNDIALATYSDDFAGEWGEGLREQFVSNAKLLSFTLPRGLKTNAQKLKNDKGGMLRLVGIGGSLTGKGFQLGIIDDPIKNAEDALSPSIRRAHNNWYGSTFLSRRTRLKGRRLPVVIMMFTRWHESDLAGTRVYDENGEVRKDWCMLHLKALAEDDDPLGRDPGEALCPSVKTSEELLEIQKEDPSWFASLYQGDPAHGDSGMFPEPSYYTTTTDHEGRVTYHCAPGRVFSEDQCVRFVTIDLADSLKTWADFSVFSVWDFHRPTQTLVLVDFVRERVESSQHEEWVRRHYRRFRNISFVGVEHLSYGRTLVQNLIRGGGMTVRKLEKGQKDKVAHALGYAQGYRNVFLPAHHPQINLWNQEHKVFPTGTHDDMVDTGSYAWEVVKSLPAVRPKKKEKPLVQQLADHVVKQQRGRRHILSGRLGK